MGRAVLGLVSATGLALCLSAGACRFDPPEDREPDADLTPRLRRVEVFVAGEGSVTADRGQLACPPGCSDEYLDGTALRFTATAQPGTAFVGWSRDAGGCGSSSTCSIVVDGRALEVEARFAATGTAAWLAHFGGAGGAQAPQVAASSDGRMTVAIGFRGELVVGDLRLTSVDRVDTLVVQFAPTGAPLWWLAVTGPGDQIVHDLAIDPDSDEIALFGYYGGPTRIGNSDQLPHVAGDLKDFFVARLSGADGATRWIRPIHASDNDDPGLGGVTFGEAGEVYIAGAYNTELSLGDTTLRTQVAGANEVFVARLARTTGTTEWARSLGGPGSHFFASAVITTGDVEIYLGGTCTGPCALGGSVITPRGASDAVWAIYSLADGSFRSQGQIGGSGADVATALARTSVNTAQLAVGYIAVPGESIVVNGQTLTGSGSGLETVLAVVGPSGQGRALRLGGSGHDLPADLVAMNDGTMLVVGTSNSPDLRLGSFDLQNDGRTDVFAGRFDLTSGGVTWAARLRGDSSTDDSAATGQVGVLSGTFGAQLDVLGTTVVNQGQGDAFVAAVPMPR